MALGQPGLVILQLGLAVWPTSQPGLSSSRETGISGMCSAGLEVARRPWQRATTVDSPVLDG